MGFAVGPLSAYLKLNVTVNDLREGSLYLPSTEMISAGVPSGECHAEISVKTDHIQIKGVTRALLV